MAKDAIEQGENAAAREQLVRLLQFDRSNPQYWLWMSAVVETLKEREFCLREVLKLDRKNPTAIHGLRILGYPIEPPEMPPGFDPLKRDWKTSLEIEKEVELQHLRPGLLPGRIQPLPTRYLAHSEVFLDAALFCHANGYANPVYNRRSPFMDAVGSHLHPHAYLRGHSAQTLRSVHGSHARLQSTPWCFSSRW